MGLVPQCIIRHGRAQTLSINRDGGVYYAKGYNDTSRIFNGHSNKTGFIILKYKRKLILNIKSHPSPC